MNTSTEKPNLECKGCEARQRIMQSFAEEIDRLRAENEVLQEIRYEQRQISLAA